MKKNVLIIDDDPDILATLIEFYTNEGFNIIATNDPMEAIDLIKLKKFNLICTDYNMPELTGDQVLKITRDIFDVINKTTPVLMITGENSYTVDGYNKDNIFFIQKPFSLDKISYYTKIIFKEKISV